MSSSRAAKETGRVEAFSDGVFAIAITLLGFTLKVPAAAGDHLGAAVAGIWPALVAFVTSFLTIGILWINHHRLFTHIRRVDHLRGEEVSLADLIRRVRELANEWAPTCDVRDHTLRRRTCGQHPAHA